MRDRSAAGAPTTEPASVEEWAALARDMAEELRAWESHNRYVLGGKFGGGQTRDEVEALTTKALLDRLAELVARAEAGT